MTPDINAPWRVSSKDQTDAEGFEYRQVIDETGLIEIAQVGGARRLVRAHLIAAAPEMAEALAECPLPSTMGNVRSHYDLFYDWYHKHVVPALAKARGEEA